MMIDTRPAPNWVADRAKCSLDLIFEALAEIVERDVAEMNKLSPKRRRGFAFRYERNGEGTRERLRVSRFPETDPDDSGLHVIFEKSVHVILIYQAPDGAPLIARPQWVETQSTCRLLVDDSHFKVWELSQRVLGPLFFELERLGC